MLVCIVFKHPTDGGKVVNVDIAETSLKKSVY